ncbi:YnbE family lipoprotein [Gammaproteobacteria bacterium LSUCC0112]|nr:YnbE family lipoprotein [Gammaproteobacteria bacterium LSUCC0112]
MLAVKRSDDQPVSGALGKLGCILTLGVLFTFTAACTPTVQVAMPSEPITINLNVRIQHEIRVRVERELDDIFSEDSGLF